MKKKKRGLNIKRNFATSDKNKLSPEQNNSDNFKNKRKVHKEIRKILAQKWNNIVGLGTEMIQ